MRILFITATRIGDAVLSSAVLGHLIDQHPGARPTVVCGPVPAALFAAVPNLERLVVMNKRRFGGHWLKLWWACVGRRWDVVVDLRGSAIAWFLPARRRHVMGRRRPGCHRVEELAAVLGLWPPPAPRLWLGPEQAAAAARLIPAGGPVLAVGPAANWRGKEWRAERVAALVERLTGAQGILPRARVAVFAAAAERRQAQAVIDAVPAARRIDLVGAVDPATAGACLGRCGLYVGNDSGLMHLAAASGIPTLGLFGPSHAYRYAPWGERTGYVRTRESCDELVTAPGFDHRATDTLMDGLSVTAAAEAAEALWRRCHGEAA